MRFGVCAGMDSARLLAEAGYDYIELTVAGDLMSEETEASWTRKRHAIEAMPLRPEVFCGFIRTGKIVGSEVDFARLRRYVETGMTRAAEVGGVVIVFGSGGARRIPEGFPPGQAHRQLLDFLALCADVSERTGVVVAIEPLCRRECNVIHLVSEGASMAREVGSPWIQNLADTYHMEAEEEPLAAIIESRDVLAHVHTADTGRFAPGTGSYDHVALFRALGQAGYDLRLSIECSWQNDFQNQVEPALAHLKSSYSRAVSDEKRGE